MNVVNHPKVAVLRLISAISACLAIFLSQAARAQQQQNFQQPSAVNPVQWTPGPTTATFNDIGQIKVPDGYQYLDEKGGRFFLEAMHNRAPKNLVGILAPNSAKWYAVIDYSAIGYVKDTDAAQLDASAILEKFRSLVAKQNVPIASMDWEIKPAYDAAKNRLEWAVRGTTGNSATVNYGVRLLGRRGVMEMILVEPQADFDPAQLREVVNGISFQDGERYADYHTGDKVARSTLSELALYGSSDAAPASGFFGNKTLWIVGILGAGLLLVIGVLALKYFAARRSYTPRQHVAIEHPQSAAVPVVESPAVRATPAPRLQASSAQRQGQTTLRRATDRNGRLSKSNVRKRRRQYNFHLFYSDMIMSLTRWNYMGGFGGFAPDYSHDLNGATAEQEQLAHENQTGKVQGGNGIRIKPSSNGSTTSSTPSTAVALHPEAAKLLAAEAAKLIEGQQKLIEGQRRLIEEQNKLIQEKSKLIDFEPSVLTKQSELVEEEGLL